MNTKTTLIAAAISGLLIGASACASSTPKTEAAPAAGEKQACKGHDGEDKNHCNAPEGEKASCSGDKASCSGDKASCSGDKGSCKGQ